MCVYQQFIEALSDQLYQATTCTSNLNLSKHPVGLPMYDNVHVQGVGYKLENLLFLVAKHSLHIIPQEQDHDPMFTVASMFRCKTSVYHSQCIYLARMGMIQGGLACSNICDLLWKNRPLAANIEFTLREFKVQ